MNTFCWLSCLWVCSVGAVPVLSGLSRSRTDKAVDSASENYFPPSESKGGWRTLLPDQGAPDAEQKARLRTSGGVDWDKLADAWKYNASAEGASGLLVIRHGVIVGEWYKDCDRARTFNIYSCSKSYTSLAFGLLLADSEAGKL